MKTFIKAFLKFTGILLIILAVILGGIFAFSKILPNQKGISKILNLGPEETRNILVAALHTEGPLTDFIMLVQYNPSTQKIVGISIPRDTKVTGSLDGKINSVYAKNKDIQDLVDKVSEITSVEIDNYVLLETEVIAQMVDEIGGIKYNVPINMNYDDKSQNLHIHIDKGEQELSGEEVVKFLRFRKNNNGTGYAMGDIERIGVQQKFIKEAVAQIISPSNLTKFPELLKMGFELVKTDITLSDALAYVDDIAKFDMANFKLDILPGEPGYIHNLSYYILNQEETDKLVNKLFFSETLEEQGGISKEEATIEVLNATQRSGLATKVANNLKEEGYNITKTGNYKTSENKQTTIINRMSNEEIVKDLKEILKKGSITTKEKGESDTDITIIVGSDY